jgi:hypothetical protein
MREKRINFMALLCSQQGRYLKSVLREKEEFGA